MRTRIGREVALLCLPVLVIGVAFWWRNRDSPPEDIMSGHARLVARVRELEASPLDRYRGYNHRIAIDQWAAGKLPPVPPAKPGIIRSYRTANPGYSPLYVTYRQGKNWRRTLAVTELAGEVLDQPTPKVKPEVASLWLPVVDDVGEGQSKFTTKYLLRLPTAPRVDEVFLCGRVRAELRDFEERKLAIGTSNDIVKQIELLSQPMKVHLELPDEAENQRAKNFGDASLGQPNWKVEKMTVFAPGVQGNVLMIDLAIRSISRTKTPEYMQLLNSRLLDGTGRELDKAILSGSGGGDPNRGTLTVNVHFEMTPQQWKSLPKPATLQTALSVNNEWPLELNLELGKPNLELPAKPSKLPFQREPLPMR